MNLLRKLFSKLRRRSIFIAPMLLSLALASTMDHAARAAGSPAIPRSQVTLLDGGFIDGKGLAGVDIQMEPHVKTYWRMPGDSGLPPIFDWSGSENLAEATVLWPLPRRIADPAGSILGYMDEVIFPIRVIAQDGTKPVHLVLNLDYAVCGTLCVPLTGQTNLVLLPAPHQGADVARIKDDLARVPPRLPLGAQLLSVMPDQTTPDAILVTTKDPLTDLYVEGPEGWYLGDAQAQSPTLWRVMILQKPTNAVLSYLHLTLTFVAPASASETSIILDASGSIR